MVYPQPFIVSNFFQEIDNMIKKYITKLIYNTYYKQMCESVYYKTFQINLNKIFTFDDDVFELLIIEFQRSEIFTPLQADEVDDDCKIYLRSLIECINQNDIGNLKNNLIYSNYLKCYQYIVLL